MDTKNSRVQKFDSNGKFLLMWGSPGKSDGQFNVNLPDEGRLAVDMQGNVYVLDADNYRVQKFDGSGKFLTRWGTKGKGAGQFIEAADIAVDRQDNVYVVDMQNQVVQKFSSNGRFLLRWGSQGVKNGQFTYPTSVAIDPDGNVLVADVGRLQKFDRNGRFLAQIDPLNLSAIQLWNVAIDNQGNIYIADNASNRIVKLDRSGNFLTAWGSSGTGEGQFIWLEDVAVDEDGNVYTADNSANSVQKFRQPAFHP
jgi:DNA-binding beta-propeller fold protein YncE